LALPGVGRYTAGALGSVCFGLEEPIVDGNVARILTRIFGIDTPLPDVATQKQLWRLAERLVVGERPGDFNQSMMELGALVCRVKSPACEDCPAQAQCFAYDKGLVEQLPCIPRKTPPRRTELVAVVASRGDQVALLRGDKALFGGLYGLPMSPLEPAAPGRDEDAWLAGAQSALASAGVRARLGASHVGEVLHVLSHRRMVVRVYRATHARLAAGSPARLLRVDTGGQVQDAEVGIARLTQKLLGAARGGAGATSVAAARS
jgi:A/G-specific adenine glycosylase